MILTNQDIYNYAIALNTAFADEEQKLPVKINFYLQKNKNTLLTMAQEIEESRMAIVKEYGSLDEESSQYIIPKENVEIASKELEDLFALEQEVNIYKVNIDNLSDNLVFTTGQMEAIMFMFE
jgi:hypothetical protein